MIVDIEIKGFRAINYVRTRVRPYQVLIGPNASGKSTFFDSLEFIKDILNVGLEGAIYGDSRLAIQSRAAVPEELSWLKNGGDIEIAITAQLPEDLVKNKYNFCRYEVAVATKNLPLLKYESLYLCQNLKQGKGQEKTLFPIPLAPPREVVAHKNSQTPSGWRKVVSKISDSGNDYFKSENSAWNNVFKFGPQKSALANLPEDPNKFPCATWFKEFIFNGVHKLALNAEKIRTPAPPSALRYYMPDGSNLPWIVYDLERKHKKLHSQWIEHLKVALPDLTNIKTEELPQNRSRYLVFCYKNGLEAPAWLVSDGSLRLAALTLLAYSPLGPRLALIEEPENGVHPKIVESILEALRSSPEQQIFLATHSPIILGLTNIKDILCFAKTESGEIAVVPGDKHPLLESWQGSIPLSTLFASGVLQ